MFQMNKELMQKMRQKTKTVYINITNQCNASCRHCINKNSKTILGEAPRNQVLEWIQLISKTSYRNVNFVGGEPFLNLSLLKEYIQACISARLTPGVTTNGFWAKTKEDALHILSELSGLKKILVSTDRYHLEYIPKESIKNLILACKELGIFVAINIVSCTVKEGQETKELFETLGDNIYININPMMPAGAAYSLRDQIETHDYISNIDELPEYCGVNDHFINCKGDIYACCMSTLAVTTNYLRFGNLSTDPLSTILESRKNNKIYQLLNEKGPKGLIQVLLNCASYEEIKVHSYTSECDLCVEVCNNSKLHSEIIKILEER